VQQPASVTTFLFTDIEGSTRLWERQPDRMRAALARHDTLAREAVESLRGLVVKTTGDGIHAAFEDPLDGIRAALKLQQTLADPDATAGVPLAVRCGLHSGIVERRNSDFFGSAVNRAARIMNAAHGGQILVSQTAVDLIGDRVPSEIGLRDLGLVRLRDLAHPERVYQVIHPALRQTFPPLRSLEATPNNLPQQVTSFVGRERESSQIKALLARSRLVTLVGTGGLGKTRLSLQVAASVIDNYSDGVWFVELAATADPRLVCQVVASVLGVTETAGQPVEDALLAHVGERHLLIILDNCEHLAAACALLAKQLLQASNTLKILTTSREALNIGGETTYALPALALPGDGAQRVTPEVLLQSEAARLFVERATAVHAPFSVTTANAPAVARVCRRLDGIPLALELAAARVRALSVEVIAERLDDCFRLLTGGDRTGLPRQQTLRALIDWSHELLTVAETTLFRRLAVFAGGFTLDAAEAVGHDDGPDAADVLDTLMRLVEKSLVERDASGDRYRLLETVRQYALERLATADEGHAQRTRHLAFYLDLARRARPKLIGPEQSEWLKRLDLERENLLAAHAWSCEADLAEQYGLQLVSSLRRYWIFRGLLALGLTITREALACPSARQPSLQRCEALLDAGQLGSFMGRYDEAQQALEESLAIARATNDNVRVSAVLQPLGLALLGRGEFASARRHLQEGLELAETLGTPREVAGALNALAQTARAEGDLATAEPLYTRVLTIARATGDIDIVAVSLLNLAMVATFRKAHTPARAMLVEVLQIVDESGLRPAAQGLLEVAAGLAASGNEWEQSGRLFGAAEAQTAATGLARDPADEAFLAPLIATARQKLGTDAFTATAAAGRALSYDGAITELRRWLDPRAAAAQ